MKRLFTALALMSAATTPATSETPRVANSRAGREVADKICAACHVVASDQKQAPVSKPPAPSFEQIARGPKGDDWTLRTFLASTHSSISHPDAMPNPQLSDDQIRDVTAYILSLREQRK